MGISDQDGAALEATLIGALYAVEHAAVEHAGLDAPVPRLPAERVRAKIRAGTPLLHDEDVAVDPAEIDAAFGALLDAAARRPECARLAESARQAIERHAVHPAHLVDEIVAGHAEHVATLLGRAGPDASLVETVGTLVAWAILAQYADRLAPALRLGSWDWGYCPVCGGWPAVTEYVGCTSTRLRCGRCATAWERWSPACPFCGSDQRHGLGVEADAVDPAWSVDGCDACRRSLKVHVGERPHGLLRLLQDDAATGWLDRAAAALGYHRASGTGYRLELHDAEDEEIDDD
ncbi:MAG: formate dehydrogenase accessory protein FdhE [Chloroflexi bacterium]|nr:formate dehydrogenase accessory protein FdhE [Chloroflexota bacterium]